MKNKNLERYIHDYIIILKKNKSLRGINNISYRIERARTTPSIYIKFYLEINKTFYRRSLRISNHELPKDRYISRSIIIKDMNDISKHTLNAVKLIIRSEIKTLLKTAPLHVIYNFKQ